MKKLLYIYPVSSSFVKSDEKLLSSFYTVKSYFFDGSIKVLTPFYFLTQLIFLVMHLKSCDKMLSQFSGYHSFLPALLGRIFNRPHYIILHGTECNNFPELNYGYLSRPLLYWFSKKSLAWSTRLFPVSEYLIEQQYSYMETVYLRQGLKAFYPQIKTPFTVIHNGVSPDKFRMLHDSVRPLKSFITVAAGLNESNRMVIKGLDLICDLALRLPDCTFAFIGAGKNHSFVLPPNILCLEYIPNDQLAGLYNQYNFYLQLSVTEGMPISLLEAMMCGCIPIVSDVGIMPDMIGPYGYVLERKNVDLLEALIRKQLNNSNHPERNEIRQWAISHYSIQSREKSLLENLAIS